MYGISSRWRSWIRSRQMFFPDANCFSTDCQTCSCESDRTKEGSNSKRSKYDFHSFLGGADSNPGGLFVHTSLERRMRTAVAAIALLKSRRLPDSSGYWDTSLIAFIMSLLSCPRFSAVFLFPCTPATP